MTLLAYRMLPDQELLRVEDLFLVTVCDQDPKRLSGAVEKGIPGELRMSPDLELNLESASGDRLDKSRNVKSWELVHIIHHCLPHFGELDKFAKTLRGELVKVNPLELLFALNLPGDFEQVSSQ